MFAARWANLDKVAMLRKQEEHAKEALTNSSWPLAKMFVGPTIKR